MNTSDSPLTPSDAVAAAEQAVLGAAIDSKTAAEIVTERLRPADFWGGKHQIIAETIDDLVENGKPVTPVAVLEHLTARGMADRVGGGVALSRLAERRSSSLRYDVDIVAKDAIRRRLLEALYSAERVATEPGFDPEQHVDRVRQIIDGATATVTGDQPPTVGEVVLQRLEDLEAGRGAQDVTALPWIDMHFLLAGLRPGQLVVIGARPSVGKSTTAMDIARCAAIRNSEPVLLISMEMGRAEIADRLLSAEATVLLSHLREGNLSESDWASIAKISGTVQKAPLVIDDNPACTLARVRARLRGMARTAPAKIAIIDYLALMQPPRAESRERAVAEISRGLKLLAMEFGVAIVALHQLNRESEKRHDKRPAMSDLRESGAIEQDADVVILLHREDVHDKESPRAGELDLIVAKNRNGPTGTVTVAYQGHYARSVDMASDYQTPPNNGRHLRAVD